MAGMRGVNEKNELDNKDIDLHALLWWFQSSFGSLHGGSWRVVGPRVHQWFPSSFFHSSHFSSMMSSSIWCLSRSLPLFSLIQAMNRSHCLQLQSKQGEVTRRSTLFCESQSLASSLAVAMSPSDYEMHYHNTWSYELWWAATCTRGV